MSVFRLQPVLSSIHASPRDTNIDFFEEDHRYVVHTHPNVTFTSTTTWIHTLFPKFDADEVIKNMMKGRNWKEGHKYWGMTPQQIKAQWRSSGDAVASAGTDLHYQIECFYNNQELPVGYTNGDLYRAFMSAYGDSKPSWWSVEWGYFLEFVRDHSDLKPYRTEWVIYHEDIQISGSIDMVFENPDGTLSIYDWKRSKEISRSNGFNKYALDDVISHMPDSNFWHYALQLNTYKAILEEKYGKKVTYLCLVRLHPNAEEETYELIPLPDLSAEVKALFAKRRS